MFADLHLHSTYSDGTDTPTELAEKLITAGITTFSLTDHDTISGIPSLIKAAENRARVITGVEFSCKENGKTTHILGYGFTPDSPAITEMIAYGHELRRRNNQMRLDYLETRHKIRFSDEENAWLLSKNSPSKLHIVMLLTQHGYASSFHDASTKYLDASKPYECRLTAGDAISAILKANAIPVWAHPLGGEGEVHISPEDLLPVLLDYGLQGMECYYSRYTMKESTYLVSLAEKHKLGISGGSDYHGNNKTVALGELCSDGISIPTEKLSVLSFL